MNKLDPFRDQLLPLLFSVFRWRSLAFVGVRRPSLSIAPIRLRVFFLIVLRCDRGKSVPQDLTAAPAYVQGAYATPQTPQTTVTVTFARPKRWEPQCGDCRME